MYIQPNMKNLHMNNKKLLVIMAHPDDAELSCYGTIRKYIDEGYECYISIASNGINGNSSSQNCDRISESKQSFFSLPVHFVTLDCMDGFISFDLNLVKKVSNIICEIRPNVVITHFPDSFGCEHQDHTAIGKAVTNAVVRYSTNLEMFLYAEPMYPFFSSFKWNYIVDIDLYYKEKIKALQAHESQNGKFYMTEQFQTSRMTRISPYLGTIGSDKNCKFELYYSALGIF